MLVGRKQSYAFMIILFYRYHKTFSEMREVVKSSSIPDKFWVIPCVEVSRVNYNEYDNLETDQNSR